MDAESSTAGRKRTKLVLSDSEDEEESRRSSPVKPNGSAHRSKRRSTGKRVTPPSEDDEEGEADEGDGANGYGSGDDDESEAPAPIREVGYKPAYVRGTDNFVVGSIVRIKLINFITYDHVEFYPGPHLNMIMGPNGTGKSTIAAGIAIGLGFPPKVVGRVNDLKSYVKQGTEVSQTEVELKGRPGKPNPVIWRSFTAMEEKSQWRLNGVSTTRKAVMELVASFDVQSNNLCSFLPQDKVAEFAKMAPEVVLRETMRAAGDPRLTKWHDQLKVKGDQRKKLETGLAEDQKEQAKADERVQRLRPYVEQLENRAQLEVELEVECLLAQHTEKKALHDAGRLEKTALQRRQKIAESKRQPLKDLAQKYENKTTKATAAGAKLVNDLKDHKADDESLSRNLNNSTKRIEDIDDKLSSLEKTEKTNAAIRRTQMDRIAKARQTLAEPMEETQKEGEELRARRIKVSEQANECLDAFESARQTSESFRKETDMVNAQLDQKSRQRDRYANVKSQRELDARTFNPSISFLLDWLNEHRHELEGEIGLPPMISVNITDPRYAWQVEMCTNLAQRQTFICNNKNDYDKLVSLQGKMVTDIEVPDTRNGGTRRIPSLRVTLNLSLTPITEASINPQRPHPTEKLQEYGFDCWAIDKVDAEPIVMAFLNTKANLYRIPLTQRPTSALDMDRINHDLGVRTFVTADSHHNSTRSAYGRRDFQVSTRQKEPSKAFGTTINKTALDGVEAEIKQLRLEKQEREAPAAKAKKDAEDLKKKHDVLTQKLREIEAELANWKTKGQKHLTARLELAAAEKRIRELDAMPSTATQRDKYRQDKLTWLKKQMGQLNELWEHNSKALGLADTAAKNMFELAVSQTNFDIIEDHRTERSNAQKELEQAIAKLNESQDLLSAECTALRAEAQKRTNGASAEYLKEIGRRKNLGRKVDVIQGDLEEIAARLEMAATVDPDVIARYEKGLEDLERYTQKVNDNEADLRRMNSQIDKILAQFNPALDRLVEVVSEKFSTFFANINCSGDVRMSRPNTGFENWGIEILVAYRDDQSLELLTGSRQSGGERSLATVTYLMSLSEMARTPFSLVDEINQGMDSRAERNVFNQLVEVTCNENAGQYFLITPKLLVNLTYHERMKVLFVENGGGLPPPATGKGSGRGAKKLRWGDMKGCLATVKASRGISAR